MTKQLAVLMAIALWNPLLLVAASPPGDVVGKVSLGYQGWFSCQNDGSNTGWLHWANNLPSPSDYFMRSWPDAREYPATYQTGFADLGNDQPAVLFSSYDQITVNTHFRWMQEHNLDTMALQRFNPNAFTNAIAPKVRAAAETYGRKFYVMYDTTNWGTALEPQIEADWTNVASGYTSSPAYALQNGKPAVCIYGLGMPDDGHPHDLATCLRIVDWFKAQGCYVIGGLGRLWRTENSALLPLYDDLDMISPWMIGSVGTISDLDGAYASETLPDQTYCDSYGIDYQPCVLPGDLSIQQRLHGDFMWHMFYNVTRAGCHSAYISMFDEFNEGNQIAKTAEDATQTPTNGPFPALNEDGTACSADYYLRLTFDGGRMLKGQLALTSVRPTPPTIPVVKQLIPGGVILLQAQANGDYVVAPDGTTPLVASGTAVGPWEKFAVVDGGNGTVALLAQANGCYVTAENAGNSALIANRTAVGPWERFTEVDLGNGRSALRSFINGCYVSAPQNGAAALLAAVAIPSGAESFTVLADQNTPFDQWRIQVFGAAGADDAAISGAAADPDGDGWSNLLEYALNHDPLVADASLPAPVAEVNPADGKTYLTLSFHRRLSAFGVTSQAEISIDLLTWSSDPALIQSLSPVADANGITELVKVRAVVPMNQAPRQFLRIRVTMP